MSGRCCRNAAQLLSPVIPLVLLLLFAWLLAADRPAVSWNNSSLASFCASGEPLAARSALAELSDGWPRVPRCGQFQLAWVLPQFPGCEGLVAALGAASENNGTGAEAARELACYCMASVKSTSGNVSDIYGTFSKLVYQLYHPKHNMDHCLSFYKDWLCTVQFIVHRDPSNASSVVSPCSEWCQSVETECPYLTPENDINSGEPVFLCHEDSYKGSGRSDRCTAAECCCYQALDGNRSSVHMTCSSQLSPRRSIATNLISITSKDAAYNVTDAGSATSVAHRLSPAIGTAALAAAAASLAASGLGLSLA